MKSFLLVVSALMLVGSGYVLLLPFSITTMSFICGWRADIAVALSMSVTHKNIFFDKKMPEVKFTA